MSTDQPKWQPPPSPPPPPLPQQPELQQQQQQQQQLTSEQEEGQVQHTSLSTSHGHLSEHHNTSLPTSHSYAETQNTHTSTTLHTAHDGVGTGDRLSFERPSGIPRCIVRVDRDHDAGDEATRFEAELFPIEFVGRVTRPEFKSTVNGINESMRVAEESMLNCLDTLLDCLTAYTAKHCCGTHYQRSIRKMQEFIQQENERIYHPAKIHLRDPQKVGMIYLEFEVF
ncbi:hypothetical protein BGZ94_003386 [Podila epigama]|nr:hypothetical protein BGZ94_003386 [Podila epigama]